jgi:DNA polymerase-3 subunit chi
MKTRIDFHSSVSNQLDYAYRLIRKALTAHCKLMVCHQNEKQLAQFDQLLWAFSTTDFLPHVVLNEGNYLLAQHTPVLLALASEAQMFNLISETGTKHNKNLHNKILINLSETAPANFAQFERLIEIVSQEEKPTQAGRGRYRFYQQQGYLINHIIAK